MGNENYLRSKNGPVIPELEPLEIFLAKDQPEYNTLRVLRSSDEKGYVMSRWQLTPMQKQLIADGTDIFLILLTFGGPPQPVQIAVAHEFDAQSAAEAYGFTIPDKALPKE